MCLFLLVDAYEEILRFQSKDVCPRFLRFTTVQMLIWTDDLGYCPSRVVGEFELTTTVTVTS